MTEPKTGKAFQGEVFIKDGERTLWLCSDANATARRATSPGALFIDVRQTLKDEVSEPNKAADLAYLLLAHACRVGETTRDVIVNCKSGKTRTPVVAIVYLCLAHPEEGAGAAIRRVANAFIEQRDRIGIDYDGKLTGRRRLDDNGKIDDTIVAGERMNEIVTWVNAHPDVLPPASPAAWKALRETVTEESGRRKPTWREKPLWTKLAAAIAAEDRRLLAFPEARPVVEEKTEREPEAEVEAKAEPKSRAEKPEKPVPPEDDVLAETETVKAPGKPRPKQGRPTVDAPPARGAAKRKADADDPNADRAKRSHVATDASATDGDDPF